MRRDVSRWAGRRVERTITPKRVLSQNQGQASCFAAFDAAATAAACLSAAVLVFDSARLPTTRAATAITITTSSMIRTASRVVYHGMVARFGCLMDVLS